ncbi:unnamed protein product [Effrenium voratum]|uniref:Uncharacterized protein n=1 Tax=Effrenium voratum TaxID=2562239 RepID=A0AA36IJJ8_9DINO|nr:unnamed protein product [Effrenium voratum]
MDGTSFCYRIGDLAIGRALSITPGGLLVKLPGQDAPALLPHQELDRSMLQMVISTRQLPAWWARCSRKVKHQAFRVACRTGRLNIMKAIYCADGIGIDTAFLTETLKEMCADAQGAADVKVTKKPKRSEDSKGERWAGWQRKPRPPGRRPGGASGERQQPRRQPGWWSRGRLWSCCCRSQDEAFPARLRGLKMLAELGPSIRDASEQIVVAVAGCLRDPEVSGRRAAADTLAQFGLAANQAPRALPRLLRLVQKDEDVAVREAAARALGSLGPEGVAAVMQLGGLDAEDAEVQGLAALALGHSGPAGAAQADRLAQLLEGRQLPLEEAIRLRLRAAQALGARADLASEADLAALAKGLQKDTEEMVREACCIAIGQIGQANKGLTTLARVSLEPGLSDAATFVQEAAADALAHLPQLGAEDFDEPQSVWQ